MNRSPYMAAALIVCILVLAAAACAAPAAKPPLAEKFIKIGTIEPLSGPAAEWGKEGEPLKDIFAEIINQEGGIKVGDDIYQLKIVGYDGPIFPPSADVAAARKLVFDDKVDCIGVYYGVANAAIAAITTPARVIFNQNTVVTSWYDPKQHPYCMFGYPNLEMSGTQPLAVALAIKAKAIAFGGVKTGNQQLEAIGVATEKIYQQQYGIKVVRVEWAPGDMDFTAYLQRMKEQGVGMIYTMENLNTVGLLKKQGIQMGYNIPIVLNGPILELDYMKQVVGGAEAMEGICGDYSGAIWDLKQTKISPYYLEFVEKIRKAWKAKTGKEMSNTGVISVVAQMFSQYIEAVKKAGTKDPDAVMKAIRGGTFDTFLGTYTLAGKLKYGSDVVWGYPCAICVIKDGRIQYLTEYPLRNIDTDVPIYITPEMLQQPGGQAPATPPAAPGDIQTSFSSSSYTSDAYGITVTYPRQWAIQMPTSPSIFRVRDAAQVPVMDVNVVSKADFDKEVAAAWAAGNITNVKYAVKDQDFKLRGGKAARYSVYTSDYPGAKLRTYGIDIDKGDKVIGIAIATLDGIEDEALFKEIFNTVVVK